MKASGAEVANRSSGVGRSRCVLKVSAIASTSAWVCMVTFGRPVVPDVGASSATSPAAVATSAKPGG